MLPQLRSPRPTARLVLRAHRAGEGRPEGVPFGFRIGADGELVEVEAEQEAVREMVALRTQGKPLRGIAEAMKAKGHQISHEGVAGVLRAAAGSSGGLGAAAALAARQSAGLAASGRPRLQAGGVEK